MSALFYKFGKPVAFRFLFLVLLLCLFSLTLGLFPCSICQAATYYVDATNGNDTNDGLSPSTAWKTIAKVNSSSFQPGDSILFKRGEIWREELIVQSSGTSEASIIFAAYGSGDNPIISGSDIITGWSKYSDTIYKASLSVECNLVAHEGIILTENDGNHTSLGLNEWAWYNNFVFINIGQNPDTKIIEVGQRDKVINLNGKDHLAIEWLTLKNANHANRGIIYGNGSTHVTIKNSNLIESHSSAIYGLFAATHWTITANTITLTGCKANQDCIGIKAYNGCTGWSVSDNTITGGRLGIRVDDGGVNVSDNWKIYNNTFINNGRTGSSFLDEGSIYPEAISGWEVFENTISDTYAYGIASTYCSDMNIHDNRIEGAESDGIAIYGTTGASYILRNFVKDAGSHGSGATGDHGIIVEGISEGVLVAHNVVVNAKNYGIADDGPAGNHNNKFYNNTVYGGCTGSGLICMYETSDSIWKNNIVFEPGGYLMQVGANAKSGFISDYNCFYDTTNPKFKWGNHVDQTFSAWQADSSQDMNSITCDPGFQSPQTGGFQLNKDSCCIDQGVDVGLSFKGTAPDIGAYEYGGDTTISPPKNLRVIKQ